MYHLPSSGPDMSDHFVGSADWVDMSDILPDFFSLGDNATIIVQNGDYRQIFDSVPRKALYEYSPHFKTLVEHTYERSKEYKAYQSGIEPWVFDVFNAWLRRPHDLGEERDICLPPEKVEELRGNGGSLPLKIIRKPKPADGAVDSWNWLWTWTDLFALYEFAVKYAGPFFQRVVLQDIGRKHEHVFNYVAERMPNSTNDIIKTMTKRRLQSTVFTAGAIADLDRDQLGSWTKDTLALADVEIPVDELERMSALVVRSWNAYRWSDCKDPSVQCRATDHVTREAESPFRRLRCQHPMGWVHKMEEETVLCTLRAKAEEELQSIILPPSKDPKESDADLALWRATMCNYRSVRACRRMLHAVHSRMVARINARLLSSVARVSLPLRSANDHLCPTPSSPSLHCSIPKTPNISSRLNIFAASTALGCPAYKSAPFSNINFVTSSYPLNTAPAIGLCPLSFRTFISAPLSIKSRTVSR